MKTTADYLDEIKEKCGLPSDYAVAIKLGLTRFAISHHRHCKNAFDNHTCLIVANTLEIPLQDVIKDMEIQREKDEKKKADWLSFESRLKGAAATIAAACSVTFGVTTLPQNAHASSTYERNILHATNYAHYRRQFRTAAASALCRLNMLFRRVCSMYSPNGGITA